jgi:hypothetical protein
MVKKIINPSIKDENGIYNKNVDPGSSTIVTDLSIDKLLQEGLINIYGIMRAIKADVGTGMPSRESVMNLKDIMAMLRDLKKDEKDLIEKLSDEELENLVK